MRVTIAPLWEELGNVERWPDLAASCDALPFSFPWYSLPWWYERGTGRLACVVVEDGAELVGLALVYERSHRIGRRLVLAVGHGSGQVSQPLLVRDDRPDVLELLWDRLATRDRRMRLSDVPEDLAKAYLRLGGRGLAVVDEGRRRRVSEVASTPAEAPSTGEGTAEITRIFDADEATSLLRRLRNEAGWLGLDFLSPPSAPFALAAVDASCRQRRLSLHLAVDAAGCPEALALCLHAGRWTAAWKVAYRAGAAKSRLGWDISAHARDRGAHKVLWPADSTLGCGELLELRELLTAREAALGAARRLGAADRSLR